MFAIDYWFYSLVLFIPLFTFYYYYEVESVLFVSIILILGVLLFYKIDFISSGGFRFLIVSMLSIVFIQIFTISKNNSIEKKFLIVMILLGSVIIVLSENLILIYLGLELQTFSLFVMIASNRGSIKSSEGGLKYFILGALSSGMLLFSISLLFYLTGGVSIENIKLINFDSKISVLIISLILLSLFFKLSMFPLHFWIPDIYEASSIKTMALVGTLPKLSVLSLLVNISIPSNILIWCSIGSIIIGTFGALNQSKVKRLLAYSGIVHMGLTVLTLGLFMKFGIEPTVIYFLIYVLTFIPIISLMISNKNIRYLSDLSGLQNANVIFSISWSLLLLSMAGLPPLSGFLTKWWTISTIINNGNNFIGFICILFSAIGLAYYLRITKIAYFQNSSSYIIWNNILTYKDSNLIDKIYLAIGFYLSGLLIVNPRPFVLLIDFCINSSF